MEGATMDQSARVSNAQVVQRLERMEVALCQRLDRIENKVEDHEKRIITIESDDSTRIMLENIQRQINELRDDWKSQLAASREDLRRFWYALILLILILAAVAGVQQIPKLPL